jgi:hypothetical protein
MKSRPVTHHALSRRRFLFALGLCVFGREKASFAMGQSGAFLARRLITGRKPTISDRDSGLVRWGTELVRRTSAPARSSIRIVHADSPEVLDEPFLIWAGAGEIEPLLPSELRGLEAFLRLGGVLVVDDSNPESGHFERSVRRELRRVVPDSSFTKLEPTHVIFKTFYWIQRARGRLLGPERIDAIVRGSMAQVLFLSCDLLGALASNPDGSYRFETEPRDARQRELAMRFAVNIAMYVLCSDYKDDQVHAPFLMRRRPRWQP